MSDCANVIVITEVNPVVIISQPQEAVVLINDAANVVDITCPETVAVIQQNATLVKVTEEATVPISQTDVSVLIQNNITKVVSVGEQGVGGGGGAGSGAGFLIFTTEGGLVYSTAGDVLLKEVA